MRINYTTQTIELTKAEAKAAGVVPSEAYNELMSIRTQNPTFKVTVNSASSKVSKKNQIKYGDMERYISAHDDENGSIMKEFNARRNAKENGALYAENFFEIKKWFFSQFSELNESKKGA